MSTRSFIARKTDIGYEGVYCHWNGYLDYNGRMLLEEYSDSEKLKLLLSFGDMSVLGSEIGEKHDFNDNAKGTVTTYYGRDRGETGELITTKKFAMFPMLLIYAADVGCEYVYLFEDGHWKYCERGLQFFGQSDGSEFADFNDLEKALVTMN